MCWPEPRPGLLCVATAGQRTLPSWPRAGGRARFGVEEREGALCPQPGQVGPRVPGEGQIKVQIWVGEQIKETPGGDGGSASPITTYRAECTASSPFQEDASLVPHGLGGWAGEQRPGGWSEAPRAAAPLGGTVVEGLSSAPGGCPPRVPPPPASTPQVLTPSEAVRSLWRPGTQVAGVGAGGFVQPEKELPPPQAAPPWDPVWPGAGGLGFVGPESHMVEGPGGGAGTGHLAALPGPGRKAAPGPDTEALESGRTSPVPSPNQQLNCRGNVTAPSTPTP